MSATKIGVALAVIAVLVAGTTYWLKYDDWVTLPSARQLVSDKMTDPASAQFRNDRLINFDWHCGEVNAKNSMGGYVGYKRFISGRLSKVVYLENKGVVGEESTEEFIRVMDKVIANLKTFNSLSAQTPDLRLPPESEQYARARGEVFEDHWKAICEPK